MLVGIMLALIVVQGNISNAQRDLTVSTDSDSVDTEDGQNFKIKLVNKITYICLLFFLYFKTKIKTF